MLHVGMDLSRTRLDWYLRDERVERGVAAPDGEGLDRLVRRAAKNGALIPPTIAPVYPATTYPTVAPAALRMSAAVARWRR